MSALFPDEEETDSDQTEYLKGGLKSPGNMENGMYTGCGGSSTRLNCRETGNFYIKTQMTGDPFLIDYRVPEYTEAS